jgi:hypothetical protein
MILGRLDGQGLPDVAFGPVGFRIVSKKKQGFCTPTGRMV